MMCPIEIGEQSELLAYSGRKLELSRAVALERHLESCSACREFVEGQRAVWQALDAWQTPPVAGDFDGRLFRRMEKEPAVWWNRWLGSMLLRPGLPLAAAACLMVAVGLILERPGAPPEPQLPASQVQNLQPEQVENAFDDMKMLSDFTRAARTDAGEL